jgi:hypothetical protein
MQPKPFASTIPPLPLIQNVDSGSEPLSRICPSDSSPAGQEKEPVEDRVNLQQSSLPAKTIGKMAAPVRARCQSLVKSFMIVPICNVNAGGSSDERYQGQTHDIWGGW